MNKGISGKLYIVGGDLVLKNLLQGEIAFN